jgi:hypothetical protein
MQARKKIMAREILNAVLPNLDPDVPFDLTALEKLEGVFTLGEHEKAVALFLDLLAVAGLPDSPEAGRRILKELSRTRIINTAEAE